MHEDKRHGGAWSESLVHRLFMRSDWQPLWFFYRIDRAWERIVGRENLAWARPRFIRKRVLWVGVGSSVRMQHLHLQKPEMMERINALESDHAIHDIRFVLAEQAVEKPAPPKPERPVCPARQRAFEQQTEALADARTRLALRRLWRLFAASADDQDR